jgi:hypothetical protein
MSSWIASRLRLAGSPKPPPLAVQWKPLKIALLPSPALEPPQPPIWGSMIVKKRPLE